MIKFILLAVLFYCAAVSCEDVTVEDLQALFALLPPSDNIPPNFDEILSNMSPDEKQQVIEWKKQAFPEHSRARKVSLEFGESDMNILRKLVEKKVPGWETFLDEDGLPTDIGRLRLYKELGYRRVSK